MKITVAEALAATSSPINEAAAPKRQPIISRINITAAQRSKKRTTKTDVILICPKGEDLKSLVRKPQESRVNNSFEIQRIIPGLNKAGTLYERPDHRNPNLKVLNPKRFNPADKASSEWRLGTFVLVVRGATREIRHVRNLYGGEEMWNARSLRSIHLPWGLPNALPYDDEGVPLKIVFPKRDMDVKEGGGREFEAGEPLLVLTAPGEDPDVMLPVIDFEGYRGEVYKLDVSYGVVDVPWGVLINKVWWQKQIDLFNEETRSWATTGLFQRIINPPPPSDRAGNMSPKTARRPVRRSPEANLEPKSPNNADKKSETPAIESFFTASTKEIPPPINPKTQKRKSDDSFSNVPRSRARQSVFEILEDAPFAALDVEVKSKDRMSSRLSDQAIIDDVDMENVDLDGAGK